jgi:hypothetical protein
MGVHFRGTQLREAVEGRKMDGASRLPGGRTMLLQRCCPNI